MRLKKSKFEGIEWDHRAMQFREYQTHQKRKRESSLKLKMDLNEETVEKEDRDEKEQVSTKESNRKNKERSKECQGSDRIQFAKKKRAWLRKE